MSWLEVHVSTDKQLASIGLILSAALFLLCFVVCLSSTNRIDNEALWLNRTILLAASCLFLVSGCVYTYESHPETFKRKMKAIAMDFETSNPFFWAALMLFIAYLAFFFYPIYELEHADVALSYAVLYLCLVVLGAIGLLVLVVASTTSALRAKNGAGSDAFHTACRLLNCDSEFVAVYFGSDLTVGFWMLFGISLGVLAVAVSDVLADPTFAVMYIFLAAAAVFACSSFGMVYTSYKENYDSSFVWETVSKLWCETKKSSYEEAKPLLHNSSY
jgi:hypothetical protein